MFRKQGKVSSLGNLEQLKEQIKEAKQRIEDQKMPKSLMKKEDMTIQEMEAKSQAWIDEDNAARKLDAPFSKEDIKRMDEQHAQDEMDRKMNEGYNRSRKSMGGKMKYAEGSMLMPPEMEMEEDMPVDTYDNIPEDEMAAAESSQLPDDAMEDSYLEFVLTESLEADDQEYLMSVLETDERLSSIFDKVMDVAGEFSGEGEVDGPGTGVSDSIPARLSDGEFVFTKKATDQMGADQLQTMMDEAEKAYDGGLMKKAFGGLTLDPMQDEKMMYGGEQMKSTQDDLRKQMLSANRMPSVLK